jgi:hypothetical protein
MKLIPTSTDSIALTYVLIITLSFFSAGLFDVLDYLIVKILLFQSLGVLIITTIYFALKNDVKKNRPEDKLQDDSY